MDQSRHASKTFTVWRHRQSSMRVIQHCLNKQHSTWTQLFSIIVTPATQQLVFPELNAWQSMVRLVGKLHFMHLRTEFQGQSFRYGPDISCEPRTCGQPADPAHGWHAGECYTFGCRITYHCGDGYELVGKQAADCQADGAWSPKELPTCVCEYKSHFRTFS